MALTDLTMMTLADSIMALDHDRLIMKLADLIMALADLIMVPWLA
jgi:hypothetical protein